MRANAFSKDYWELKFLIWIEFKLANWVIKCFKSVTTSPINSVILVKIDQHF